MKKAAEVIEIRPVELKTVTVRVRGTSPLIMHKWSEKAKKMILDTQTKSKDVKGKKARDPKNPVEDFIEAAYWMDGKPTEYTEEAFDEAVKNGARWGFPAVAFKAAVVSGAYRTGMTKDMASVRSSFMIKGVGVDQLVEIKGAVPEMREDMVRVGMGAADIRHRPQFNDWYADLDIVYNAQGQYSLEQLLNLINLGGFAVGVGEWRPEKDGTFGTFMVEAV